MQYDATADEDEQARSSSISSSQCSGSEDFYVFTKNARLNKDIKVACLLGELESVSWDVILFSEARAKSSVCEVAGGHRLITCLKEAAGSGTGILVHARLVGNILAQHLVSDRVIAVDIKTSTRTVRCIAVYAPHAGARYTAEDLQAFYDQLSYIVSDGHVRGYKTIIGGDFNTQFGVGPRGAALAEFADAYHLRATNSSGNGCSDESWTFCSYLGVKRRLDYILVSDDTLVVEAGPSGYIDLGSDHRAVRAHLQLKRRIRRTRSKQQRGWKPAHII